jgi:hypothetical protein
MDERRPYFIVGADFDRLRKLEESGFLMNVLLVKETPVSRFTATVTPEGEKEIALSALEDL